MASEGQEGSVSSWVHADEKSVYALGFQNRRREIAGRYSPPAYASILLFQTLESHCCGKPDEGKKDFVQEVHC
jgi:hypothetical protein